MEFTDEELMMLEQLTYLNDACKLAKVPASKNQGETVGDRLSGFTESALVRLEESGAEGQQWAAIIRYMQGNEKFTTLMQGEQFRSTDEDSYGRVLATAYYYEPKDSGQAVVTFHGTSTPGNWYDNATGLGTSDTEVQLQALEYINTLPYDDITVVGHSKGGNLSQYVTITSDKVNRCVSMDGQGFSQEFLDKYWAQINLKGHLITNYSLSTDFVHILLYPIPNSTQDYCAGDRVDGLAENHYSNSFFHYETIYVDGKPVTVIETNNGNPVIYNGQTENEMMTYLHEFTCFVIATMPQDERIDIGDYVGNILKLAMTGEPVNGYTDVFDYVMSDKERLSTVLAYLIKYVEVYNLSEDEVRGLMSALGMEKLVDTFDEVYKENKFVCDLAIGKGKSLLMSLLTGIKYDPIFELILNWVAPDIADVLRMTKKEYIKMPTPPANANQNATVRQEKVYEYSQAAYDALTNTYNNFSQTGSVNLSDWTGYADARWYVKLCVGSFVTAINKYNSKMTDFISTARTKTDEAFQAIADADGAQAQKVSELVSSVNILVLASR